MDINYDMNGYISNVRIVKGTALYTSNFIYQQNHLRGNNTVLLCCQSTTDVTEGAVKPADVSWVPTGYTYWNGMNDNWNDSGTTTSDKATDGDCFLHYLLESITLRQLLISSQYRVLGLTTGQSGAGANYTDNLFGWYWNGTGTPPLFLTRTSAGNNRSEIT